MLDGRTQGKYWTFELYPDSMNPNSFKLLEELGGSYAHVMVSPLHDSDIKKDGTPKKAHYHVLIAYGNKVNYLKFYNFAYLECNGVIPPEPRVGNVDHMRAYFVHRTPAAISDGKHIYRCEDCLFFSDKWYLEEFKRLCEHIENSGLDKTDFILDLIEVAEYYDLKGIYPLLNWVRSNCPELCSFVISNQSTLRSLLASMTTCNYDHDSGKRIVAKPKELPALYKKVNKIFHGHD